MSNKPDPAWRAQLTLTESLHRDGLQGVDWQLLLRLAAERGVPVLRGRNGRQELVTIESLDQLEDPR